MPKKQKKADSGKRKPKLGRPEELKIDDLPKRFHDMKLFLENYWGRVGLGLRRARQPEDIKSVLSLVQGIEWMTPFKGHAICLIKPMAIEVSPEGLHSTRSNYKAAEQSEESCWAAYHEASPRAQQAATALQQAISQFDGVLDRFEFFFVLSWIADTFKVKELTTEVPKLWDAVLKAQQQKNALKAILEAQEARFARNEVVKFAKNRRHSKSLLNFARAMAGLPEWGWFHSRRTCEAMRLTSEAATPAKLFEFLDSVIRKTKPLKLSRVEKRVRRELLESDVDLFLREYAKHHWYYLEESIHFCTGKNFKRSELTFKIMDRFIYHTERGKSTMKIELAKRNELR